MEKRIRIRSKVKIINTIKKNFLGKEGRVIDKRLSYFGNKEFLIGITFKSGNYRCIWQSEDDLERIK